MNKLMLICEKVFSKSEFVSSLMQNTLCCKDLKLNLFFLVGLLVGVFMNSCGGGNKKVQQLNEKGKMTYQKYCGLCHGEDGKLGLSDATNLATSTLPKDEIITIIREGRGMMQAYEELLTIEQIQQVSDYIITLRN